MKQNHQPSGEHSTVQDIRQLVEQIRSKTLANADNLPSGLRSLKAFLLFETTDITPTGKFNKIPVWLNGKRRKGTQGSEQDLENLCTLEQAVDALRSPRRSSIAGIGIAMLPQFGLVGVDIDGCITSTNGDMPSDLEDLLDSTYVEYSPSGTGLRAFFWGEMIDGKNNPAGFEIFHSKGFLTLTGDAYYTDNTSGIAKLTPHITIALEARVRPTKSSTGALDNVVPFAKQQTNDLANLREFSTSGITPDIERAKSYLSRIQVEGYDEWIRVGMALQGSLGLLGLEPYVAWSRTQPGYVSDEDVRAKYASFASKGLTIGTLAHMAAPQIVTWPAPKPSSLLELSAARLTPTVIVDGYLYADVGLFPAPGATGKTTLMLYEAACIAGGAPTLHGWSINNHGPVVFISAEDQREQLIARLRRVIADNGMLHKQTEIIENIYINDVSGLNLRLTSVAGDVVVTSAELQSLIDHLTAIKPVLVIIDPAVSFGVGESRVNDAEQGLISAGRLLRDALDCCVRFVHHTGKANAREGRTDQYTGRGGSAFADGARMVHVLTHVEPSTWAEWTGDQLPEGASGLKLSIAKNTFSPQSGDVLLMRQGFHFTPVQRRSAEEVLDEDALRLLEFLEKEMLQSRRYSKNLLEKNAPFGWGRARLRHAVEHLIEIDSVVYTAVDPTGERGGLRAYLLPREKTFNGYFGSPKGLANQPENGAEND